MSYHASVYSRRARANNAPSRISHFQTAKLDDLPLGDLRKIKKSIAAFGSALNLADVFNEDAARRNKIIKEKNNFILTKNKERERDFEEKIVKPYRDLITEICNRFRLMSVGLLRSAWIESFMYDDWRLPKTPEALRLVAEHKRLDAGWHDAVSSKRPEGEVFVPEVDSKPAPRRYVDLTLGGTRVRVLFSEIDLERLDNAIASAETEKKLREEKAKGLLRHLQARAAANEFETRALARNYKSQFSQQISLHNSCPYCSKALMEDSAHLDHIYPVSKGGKSLPGNLVFVCSSCNLRKSNLTLTSFVNVAGFELVKIHRTLATLAKDF